MLRGLAYGFVPNTTLTNEIMEEDNLDTNDHYDLFDDSEDEDDANLASTEVKLQQTNKHIEQFHFKDQLLANRDVIFDYLKSTLIECTVDVDEGKFRCWCDSLINYIQIYGYAMPKEDHIFLVNHFYNIFCQLKCDEFGLILECSYMIKILLK